MTVGGDNISDNLSEKLTRSTFIETTANYSMLIYDNKFLSRWQMEIYTVVDAKYENFK